MRDIRIVLMQKYRTCVHTRMTMAWQFSSWRRHVYTSAFARGFTVQVTHFPSDTLESSVWHGSVFRTQSNPIWMFTTNGSNPIQYDTWKIKSVSNSGSLPADSTAMSWKEFHPASVVFQSCVFWKLNCAPGAVDHSELWKGHMSEKCLATCRWQLGIGYKNINVFLGNNIGLLPSSRPAAFYTPSKDYTSARS